MAYIKFEGGYYKGETLFGVPDGEGTAYYDNGNTYHGQWSQGMCYGKGEYIEHNGSRYEGEFFFNKMQGDGKYWSANGTRYEGHFQNNHIESGTVYYRDGYKYTGTFDERWLEHGYGEMYYLNGDCYKGQWQHGKINGEGIIYYATGATKKGTFKDDKENGSFIFDYPFLKLKWVVEFKDGKQVSADAYYDYNGNRIDKKSVCLQCDNGYYIGEIRDNKRHGKGIFWFNDERCYVGSFDNDSLHGDGVMYYKNGKRFVGKWEHGAGAGKGVWYFANGTKRLAEYKNGKVHLGEVIDADKDFPNDITPIKSNVTSSQKNTPMPAEGAKKSSNAKKEQNPPSQKSC